MAVGGRKGIQILESYLELRPKSLGDSRNIAVYIKDSPKLSCWYSERPFLPAEADYPNKDFYNSKKSVLLKYQVGVVVNQKNTIFTLGS